MTREELLQAMLENSQGAPKSTWNPLAVAAPLGEKLKGVGTAVGDKFALMHQKAKEQSGGGWSPGVVDLDKPNPAERKALGFEKTDPASEKYKNMAADNPDADARNEAPPMPQQSTFNPNMLSSGSTATIAAHEGRTVSQRVEDLVHQGLSEEAAANQARTEAEIRTTQAAGSEAAGLAGVREGLRLEREKKVAQRAGVLDNHYARQEQMKEDIRSTKIDPSMAFGEGGEGAFRKIGAILAMAAGGFAAGMRGGPNMAAEIINKHVDDFVGAQKANLENKKSLLAEERGALADKRQQFGDEDVADEAHKQDMLAAAQAMAESHMSDAKTDEQRAGLMGIQAALKEKAAAKEAAIHPWVQAQTVSTGTDRRKEYAATLQHNLDQTKGDFQKAQQLTLAQMGLAKAPEGQVYEGKGGKGGKAQQGLVQQDAAIGEMINIINEEIADTKKGFHVNPFSDDALKMKSDSEMRVASIIEGLPKAKTGTTSDAQLELWKHKVPAPLGATGAISQTARIASYEQLRKQLEGSRTHVRSSIKDLGGGGGGEEETKGEE